MTDDDRQAACQLQWATQALALDSERQLELFPDFVDKPFELVDDFENWHRATLWRADVLGFTTEQRERLRELHEAVLALPDTDMSEQAVHTAASWERLRGSARRVLESFGWPDSPPPSGRSAYIPAG